MSPTDPLIAHSVLPVAIVILVAVLLRFGGGPGLGARLASIGLPLAVVAAVIVSPGIAPTPPVSALAKLVWMIMAGGLIGMLIEFLARTRLVTALIVVFWPALAIIWVGGIDVTTAGEPVLYRIGEIGVVAGVAMLRLHQIANDALDAPVTGVVIAAGLAALALVTGPAYATVLGWPLAAAGLGWLICNWPKPRLPFAAPGDLGASAMAIALAAVMVYSAGVNALLVLLVLAALVMQPLARRIVAANALTRGEAVRPIATAVLIALPPLAAVLLALYAPNSLPLSDS